MSGAALAHGRLIERSLRGAWRAEPPPPEVSIEELLSVAPALLRTASAPLAFWRNRTLPGSTPALEPLHDAWRLQALHASVLEARVPAAVSHLRAAGVDPLLAKGWALARLYPRPGLRPYGDLDLYVRPAEYAKARAAIDTVPGLAVDLHLRLDDFGDDGEKVLSRAVSETIGHAAVRVPAPEDHLRLVCRHFLRHGASRPVWLCDVALLVENRAPGFDWDLLLAGGATRRDAVLAAIGLAGELLGADLAGTPAAKRSLPSWLVPTVLRQWAAGVGHREPLAAHLYRPAAFLAELRRHWPNGIEASAVVGAPFDRLPRLPFQVFHVCLRAVQIGMVLARGRRS